MSVTFTKGNKEWWLLRTTRGGNYRYPKRIRVGDLERGRIYIPERRYKRLANIAKDMWETIACNDYPTVAEHYREKLEALGVSLDG